MDHVRWDAYGRTYSNGKNEFIYCTSVSTKNVDIGNGEFAPYVWDSLKKEVKFATCKLVFTSSGVEVHRGIDHLYTFKVHQELWNGLSWDRVISSASKLSTKAGNQSFKETLYLSYKLTSNDQEAEIGFTVGCSGIIRNSFKIKSNSMSKITQRIVAEHDIKEDPVLAYTKPEMNSLHIAYVYKEHGIRVKWKPSEVANRTMSANSSKTEIMLGQKEYKPGEEVVISPDTTTLEAGYSTDVNDADVCYPSDGSDWVGYT